MCESTFPMKTLDIKQCLTSNTVQHNLCLRDTCVILCATYKSINISIYIKE